MDALARCFRWVAVIVGLLLVGEAVARFGLKLKPGPLVQHDLAESIAKYAEFDPKLGIRYKPNVDILLDSPTDDFSFLFKTNEIGLRDRPMGTHLRAEYKFLIFGDEFIEGWGTDIDETAVVRAQNAVNQRTNLKPPVRFVIVGKSGYGAAQNYLMAPALIDSLQPKGVVFFYSGLMPHADQRFLATAKLDNGMATGVSPSAGTTPVLPHGEDYPRFKPGLLTALAPYSAGARALAEKLAFHAMAAAIKPGDPATDRLSGMRGDTNTLQAALAPTFSYITRLATLADQNKIPFLLIHLPLPPQVAANEWTQGRKLFGVPDELQPATDLSLVQNFCVAHKLRCVNAFELFQKAAKQPNAAPLYCKAELAFTPTSTKLLGAWFADELYRWMGELRLL